MAENVVTRYDPHFHLGMRVMTLIWCFRGWQVCLTQILPYYHLLVFNVLLIHVYTFT